MKAQVVVVVVFLVAGAIFAVLNQSVVVEKRAVQLPWGVVERAVVQDLLAISTVALLLLLVLSWIGTWAQARARRRLADLLAQREHEVAGLKGQAYDEVSQRLDALRQDLSSQIADLRASLQAGPQRN